MNIFWLSWIYNLCASFLCDQHVVKMCTESTQIVYTSIFLMHKDKNLEHYNKIIKGAPLNKKGENGYKPAYPHHPCNIWASKNKHNFKSVINMGISICEEYKKRYNKKHACYEHLLYLRDVELCQEKENEICAMTRPPLCFGKNKDQYVCKDKYGHVDVIESYTLYYIKEKSTFARYRKKSCPPPKWIEKRLGEFALKAPPKKKKPRRKNIKKNM